MGNGASVCDAVNLKRQLTVLVVGLDNSGKTCTSRALVGETFADVTPTVGFSKFVTRHRGISVNIYDLGGSSRIRDIWKNYFAETHGVVFVIDASDPSRLQEAKQSLTNLMKHTLLRGKPLLLLANKQDHADALDEIDVADKLQLEMLANECQTPTRIEICSATQGTGKNIDPIIRIGFQWLVESILHHYEAIQRRVIEDVAKQKAAELLEKEARKERIQKLKALQDFAEEEVAGVKNHVTQHLHNFDPANGGNPFRPLHEIAEEWNLPGSVSELEASTTASSSVIQQQRSQIDQKFENTADRPTGIPGPVRGIISAPGQLPADRNSGKTRATGGRGPQQANSAPPSEMKSNSQQRPVGTAKPTLPPLKRNS